jgi:hypothetical protein
MTVLDLVYSPDDDGWYAHEYDLDAMTDRVSLKVYPSRQHLERALDNGTHEWEEH